jgi:predicted RNA binding protein YcfA (HicA-like mRNA interferase family)
MNPKAREVIADLEKEGWSFTRTSKGHWKGKHPDAPRKVLILSGSTSDWRADANARSLARRLVS